MADTLVRHRKVSDRTVILEAQGALDPAGSQVLALEFAEAFSQRYQNVILDMTSVDNLGSAGIGVIFTNREKFRADGGDLILCGLSDNIRFVLRELDLLEQMTISTDVQQAITATDH